MNLDRAPSALRERSAPSATRDPATLSVTPQALANADRIAALGNPFTTHAELLTQFAQIRQLGLSTTDLFSGLGSASLGAVWAGAVPVAGYNHWRAAPPAHPVADPRIYLEFEDHTDTWDCPSCRQPITEVYDCRTLGALQTAITGHRCPPADDTGTTEPQPTSPTN